jgi:hypothetical protein
MTGPLPQDVPLFDLPDTAGVEPTPAVSLTDGQRRNARHLQRINHGIHPLGPPLRLHPDADRTGSRDGPGPRCGTCQHRILVGGGHARSFPKCVWPKTEFSSFKGSPRVSFSIASDVRTWWPACTDYQPQTEEP